MVQAVGLTFVTVAGLVLVPGSPAAAQVRFEFTTYPAPTSRSVVGDLDADGDLDQVALTADNVLTWLNDGTGTFGPVARYAGDDWPAIQLVDLDGDGDDDFVAAVPARDVILVRLADHGRLGSQVTFAAGNAPDSVESGDLDGDGAPDLVVGGERSAEVRVLLGTGDGRFEPPTVFRGGRGVENPSGPRFAIGDVQGDGRLDVVAIDTPNRRVLLLPGDGAGGLGTARPVLRADGGTLVAVRLAQMDANPTLDLVVGFNDLTLNYLAGVAVAVGDGTGRFGTPQVSLVYGPTNTLGSLDVGRVDGDARPDVLAGLSGGGRIFLNTGGGRLSDELPTGAYLDAPLVADLDGDGLGDLSGPGRVMSDGDYGLVVARNLGPAAYALPFSAPTTYPVGRDPRAVALGELTGDGRLDVLVANSGSDNLALLRGDGAGGLSRPAFIPVGDEPGQLVLADVDGDADQDVVVLTRAASGQGYSVLFHDGRGSFRLRTGTLGADSAYRLFAADVDDDAFADLVYSDNQGIVTTLRGDGAGGFTGTDVVDAGTEFAVPAVADLDGDGYTDLAVPGDDGDRIVVRLGDGTGGYTTGAEVVLVDAGRVRQINEADVDGDGVVDLVTTRVYFGAGDGTFEPAPSPAYFVFDRFADLDGNGTVDSFASDRLQVSAGLGSGEFVSIAGFVAGPLTQAVAAGDLDGDGRLELVAVDLLQDVVSVLRNLAGPRPADLQIFGARAQAPTISPGETLTVTDSVANLGTASSAPTQTRYTLVSLRGDVEVPLPGTRTVPPLAPGAVNMGEVAVVIPTDVPFDDYRVQACLTGADVYAGNDCTFTQFFEIGLFQPDLRIRVVSSGGSYPPGATISVGEEVRNRGVAPAAGSTTRYLLSLDRVADPADVLLAGGRAVRSLEVEGLDAGTGTPTIPLGTPPGTYYVLACADYDDAVAEASETNNCGPGNQVVVGG